MVSRNILLLFLTGIYLEGERRFIFNFNLIVEFFKLLFAFLLITALLLEGLQKQKRMSPCRDVVGSASQPSGCEGGRRG